VAASRSYAIPRLGIYKMHVTRCAAITGNTPPGAVVIDLQDIVDRRTKPIGLYAFEFHHWMTFLESNERGALTLRFVEEVASFQMPRKAGHTPTPTGDTKT